jgi:outer membrane protein assembly factor BamB
VVEINAATGKIVWDTKVPGDPTGAVTVVNDLVLTATYQGTFVAINRSNGRIVWRYTLPGGVNGWMSLAGNLVVIPIGATNPPEVLALQLPTESKSG